MCRHDQETLYVGDVVVMVEVPGTMCNFLLRERDMTLHKIKDASDQYVVLSEDLNARR